jgi:endonuclease/exonuclease/phosphatase family metal-dependent hydrolase
MQRFLLPVALFTVAVIGMLSSLPAGPSSAHASQDSAAFSVASWNMENFFDKYDDPYRRDEVTKPAYVNEARQRRCAAVLRELNADVVAIQEVENRFLVQEFLDTYLADMGYELVHLEGNDSRGIDCALLSRVPIRAVTSYQHRRFLGADGMLQHFRRDLLRVSLGAPFNGDVYVVHLKSQFGDEAADIVREAESAEITRILAENAAGRSDYRAVVIGDFNEVPELPTITNLIKGGLVDPMAGTEGYTYNKEPYLTRIDFALMTPALAKGVKAAHVVNQLGDHDLEACSDHYPLLVQF